MSKGLLEVEGTLSAAQFWPNGNSDADAAHVVVSAFRFNGRVTHAFDDATVKRSANANSGKPVQNKKHEVTATRCSRSSRRRPAVADMSGLIQRTPTHRRIRWLRQSSKSFH